MRAGRLIAGREARCWSRYCTTGRKMAQPPRAPIGLATAKWARPPSFHLRNHAFSGVALPSGDLKSRLFLLARLLLRRPMPSRAGGRPARLYETLDHTTQRLA